MKVALFMQASVLEEEPKACPHVAEIDRLKRSEHLPVLLWPDLPALLSPCVTLVSELAVEEIRSLNEQVAKEKELRVRAQQEAQEVRPEPMIPAWVQLPALQAQVGLEALTSRSEGREEAEEEASKQLRETLAQLESLQRTLDLEREERASVEEEFKTQLLQLQQSGLAEENNSEHPFPLFLAPPPSSFDQLVCFAGLQQSLAVMETEVKVLQDKADEANSKGLFLNWYSPPPLYLPSFPPLSPSSAVVALEARATEAEQEGQLI